VTHASARAAAGEEARGRATRPIPTRDDPSAVSENAELVRAWHEAAYRGRIDELIALTHPDFETTEPSALPGATHLRGREALRSYCYGWAKNWSETEFVEHELSEIPPDRVVVEYTVRLRGLRSSIWVEHRWVYLLQIRDGLIVRDDGFATKDELLATTGTRPA
jgi:ketosteroid isomerase-like protein